MLFSPASLVPVILLAASSALALDVGTVTASVTAASGSNACATVSSLLLSHASASPSATSYLKIPAGLAYDCSREAPIVKQDALDLIDGLTAFIQWQSTLTYLKNPPEGYLLAGVDILGGMQKLRNSVETNAFTSEIDFETALVDLIGQAHDGHFLFVPDGMSVFEYTRQALGPLVSISRDGKALPEIWSFRDLYLDLELSTQLGWTPSPILTIDGQNASKWLTTLALNGTIAYQDPDALYNSLFYEVANADTTAGTFLSQLLGYPGPSINVTFTNGTKKEYPNYAITTRDFTGVNSGDTFYLKFCNATQKALNLQGGSGTANSASPVKLFDAADTAAASSGVPSTVPTPTAAPRTGYPPARFESPDGSLAGYFLNGTGYENTAVLSILSESETDAAGCQQAMREFLAACRSTGKTHLVIDVSSNPGGAIIMGYEYFKQLFPTIDPYGAGEVRAIPQYDVLGQFITGLDLEVEAETPGNITNFINDGGYTLFDAIAYDNASNSLYESWADFFGPMTHHGDQFTNLFRLNISDPNFDEAYSNYGIVVSGYGNQSNVPPQPFQSENMILLGDGACSSTCGTLGHLLKWQGKVKSVVLGGRPQTGPMQYIGGVKGKQVYPLDGILQITQALFEQGTSDQIAAANQTGLATINELGEYVNLRCGDVDLAGSFITVNIQNSIAEGDETVTPLQFVYEAADCRLWWTPDMIFDISAVWMKVASQAFGLNGTTPYSGCVAGSTKQPSSLSGNPTLYNGGKPDNVTSSFSAQADGSDSSSPTSTASGSSTSSGGSSTSAGSSSTQTGAAGKVTAGSSFVSLLAMFAVAIIMSALVI